MHHKIPDDDLLSTEFVMSLVSFMISKLLGNLVDLTFSFFLIVVTEEKGY